MKVCLLLVDDEPLIRKNLMSSVDWQKHDPALETTGVYLDKWVMKKAGKLRVALSVALP
ncbi:hypothetical protein [Paenibacillus ginsengarvi]|uniref:hypothetical protein n=1 Tax=Paenibacillus ginsengarvi TaxID=400777 RepID=UPI001315182E|nr:hypothetical protein [Paenibacillus ginsengarvi]